MGQVFEVSTLAAEYIGTNSNSLWATQLWRLSSSKESSSQSDFEFGYANFSYSYH